MSWLKWLFVVLGIAFLALQFIRPDISVPDYDATRTDLIKNSQGAPELLRAACYDCHSYESELPWYASINPAGLLIRNHIRVGREELNFSLWGTYSAEDRIHLFEECAEEVLEGHMPIRNYTWLHPEARLDQEQRQRLADWFGSLARAERIGATVEPFE